MIENTVAPLAIEGTIGVVLIYLLNSINRKQDRMVELLYQIKSNGGKK